MYLKSNLLLSFESSEAGYLAIRFPLEQRFHYHQSPIVCGSHGGPTHVKSRV